MNAATAGQLSRLEGKEIDARVRAQKLSSVHEEGGFLIDTPRRLNARQKRRQKRHMAEEIRHLLRSFKLEDAADPKPLSSSWLE